MGASTVALGGNMAGSTEFEKNRFETILVDAPAAGVCRITLNRPEKRNAISTQLRSELLSVLEQNDKNPDVKVCGLFVVCCPWGVGV